MDPKKQKPNFTPNNDPMDEELQFKPNPESKKQKTNKSNCLPEYPDMIAHFAFTLDDLKEKYIEIKFVTIESEQGTLTPKELRDLLSSRINVIVYENKLYRFVDQNDTELKYINFTNADGSTELVPTEVIVNKLTGEYILFDVQISEEELKELEERVAAIEADYLTSEDRTLLEENIDASGHQITAELVGRNLTIILKDANGEDISSDTVELDEDDDRYVESGVLQSGVITFTYNDGGTFYVDINDLITGLATETYVDNAVNQVSDDLAAEVERAGQAENTLSQHISAIEEDYLTSADKTELENAISAVDSTLSAHISDESNPHNVTKAQVGLGNVDNTSDANKPISNATQEALDAIQTALDLKADESDLQAEVSRATAEEGTLQSNIDAEAETRASEITRVDGRITGEISRATAAEAGLQTAIDVEEARAKGIEANLRTDITELQGRDYLYHSDIVDNTITADATKVLSANQGKILRDDLTDEAEARQAADTTLQTNINSEVGARQSADTALSNRISNIESGYGTPDINTSSIGVQYTKSTSKDFLISNATWNESTIPSNYQQLSCAYGGKYFLSGGAEGDLIYFNSESRTWSKAVGNLPFDKVAFGNGYFLTLDFNTKLLYKIYPSKTLTNLDTYTPLSDIIPTNLQYINNQYMITGENGKIAKSVSWSEFKVIDTNVDTTLKAVAYGNSAYVAVGENGEVLISKDGDNWNDWSSSNTLITDCKKIIYYNGRFTAVGEYNIWYSDNYYQFQAGTITDLGNGYHIQDIIAGDSVYYLIATNNTDSKIFRSTNGRDFTLNEEKSDCQLLTIAYGDENYFALGNKAYNLNLQINWSYTRPEVDPSTEYLWCRDVNNLNNGDVLYSAAYYMGYVDKYTNNLENYYNKPTAKDIFLDNDDAIEDTEINNLFN